MTSFVAAIEAKGSSATVHNFGTIAATGAADGVGVGVYFFADGTVVNGRATPRTPRS